MKINPNQPARVLDFLKTYGTINPIQSWEHCGVYRLSAVILMLRKQGYNIETERGVLTNSFGETCNFAKYRLFPETNNSEVARGENYKLEL